MKSEKQTQDSSSRLQLIIDFEAVDLDDLAELLTAIRSVAFRALIKHLRTMNTEEGYQPLSWLSISYRKFMEGLFRKEMYIPELHYRRRWWPDFEFERLNEEEPPFFEEWTKYAARKYNLEIRSITLGSYDFAIFIAGMLYIAGPQDWAVNYSLAKDITNQIIAFIRDGIIHPKPKGHLESVPDIVEKLAKNSRITKLEVRANDASVNVKAEFQKRKQ